MALDRVYELYRGGLLDRNPLQIWAQPIEGSPIIASIDDDVGRPVETAVVRMRWRDDVELESVLVDVDQGRIWIPSELREVGRRRWLDVAMTHYEDAAIQTVDPAPPTTSQYTAQDGYTLMKDGTLVQNLTIARISVLLADEVRFRLENPGAAGVIPDGVVMRFGAAGAPYGQVWQVRGLSGFVDFARADVTVAADDQLIPARVVGQSWQSAWRVAGHVAPGDTDTRQGVGRVAAVGGYVRILSTTEYRVEDLG